MKSGCIYYSIYLFNFEFYGRSHQNSPNQFTFICIGWLLTKMWFIQHFFLVIKQPVQNNMYIYRVYIKVIGHNIWDRMDKMSVNGNLLLYTKMRNIFLCVCDEKCMFHHVTNALWSESLGQTIVLNMHWLQSNILDLNYSSYLCVLVFYQVFAHVCECVVVACTIIGILDYQIFELKRFIC